MNEWILKKILFILCGVSFCLTLLAAPATLRNDAGEHFSVGLILENASDNQVKSEWQIFSGLSFTQFQELTHTYYRYKTKLLPTIENADVQLAYKFNTLKNLSDYSQLSLLIKGEAGVQLRIALVNKSNRVFFQKDSFKLVPEFSTFVLPLSAISFENTQAGESFDFKQISAIQFYFLGDKISELTTIDIAEVALLGRQSTGIGATSINALDVSFTLQVEEDKQAPTVKSVTLDGKPPQASDFVSNRPLVAFLVTDNRKVATVNATLKRSSGAIIQSFERENKGADTELDLSFQVNNNLADGFYELQIIAIDEDANTSEFTSKTFQVKNDFELSNVLNGPNPFNPNVESTSISYQLSHDAPVDVYIYSISGEQLWTRSFSEGEENGGAVGYNEVVWSGKNKYAEIVANGPYIGIVVAKRDGVHTKKFKLLVLK